MKVILLVIIGFNLLNAELTRVNEIVHDSVTKLYWQDTGEAKTTYKNWRAAIDYCEALTLNTQGDWRLPNKNEFLSIVDYSLYNPSVSNIFKNILSSTYWSSTISTQSGLARGVNLKDGSTNSYLFMVNGSYVRCVRGGQ